MITSQSEFIVSARQPGFSPYTLCWRKGRCHWSERGHPKTQNFELLPSGRRFGFRRLSAWRCTSSCPDNWLQKRKEKKKVNYKSCSTSGVCSDISCLNGMSSPYRYAARKYFQPLTKRS